MKYDLKIHLDPPYAEVVANGKATAADFEQITQELISHEDFFCGINFLHDYRDIQAGHLTLEEVRSIAVMVGSQSEVLGNGRWAILVNSDLNFGMGRMWQILVSDKVDLEIGIYREESKARNWVRDS